MTVSTGLDLGPNEEIVLRAKLQKSHWMRFRCWSVAAPCLASMTGAFLAPLYWIAGYPCRTKEADSFELVLTNRNIHFRQKIYQCCICCQNTQTKIIPLEKIQDIVLVSNCCGDTCCFVDEAGQEWQMHFQTAGMGPLPELSVFCIENPREFKRAVLEAKTRIESNTHITGQSKAIDVALIQAALGAQQQQQSGATAEQNARILHVLELLERQLTPTQAPMQG